MPAMRNPGYVLERVDLKAHTKSWTGSSQHLNCVQCLWSCLGLFFLYNI